VPKERRRRGADGPYVWLADRRRGVSIPRRLFYPHSEPTSGLRQIERYAPVIDDRRRQEGLAMIRNLLDDESVPVGWRP